MIAPLDEPNVDVDDDDVLVDDTIEDDLPELTDPSSIPADEGDAGSV